MTLTWALLLTAADVESGAECSEHQCVSQPRVTRLVQRPNRDAEYVTTYSVRGLVNYYHSAAEAIAAAQANPE